MLEDYTRYLVSIRDSLIQCGVSFPVTPIESYMNVLDLGARLDSVLWYYSMLEISGSRKSLRGFLLPLGRCYLFEMRRRAYEEYKGIIATYDVLRVKPEKNVKNLEKGSSTQENMVYLLQYIGHGRYVEDIVGESCIKDDEQHGSSWKENRELAEFIYGSDSYSSVGRYVEDIVNSSDNSTRVDENCFEEPEDTEPMVDENGFEIEEEFDGFQSYSEPEVDEYGFELPDGHKVDENGFEEEEDSYGVADEYDTPEPKVDEYGFEISDEPESVPYEDEEVFDEPEVDEYGFELSDESESVPVEEDVLDEPEVDENGFEIDDEPESVPVDDEDAFEEPMVDEYGFELPDEPQPTMQGNHSNDILDRLKETGTSVSVPAVPVKDFSDTLQEKTNEILTKGKRAVIRGIRRLEK